MIFIKSFVETDNVTLNACDCKGADVSTNYKEWTQKDIYNLATHDIGHMAFDVLIKIASASIKVNEEKTAYTEDALLAQAAIKEFTPEGMAHLDYLKMLAKVDKETREIRKNLTIKDEEKLKRLQEQEARKNPQTKSPPNNDQQPENPAPQSPDGAGTVYKAPANNFNPQEALALLDKAEFKQPQGLVLEGSELKAPLNTDVTDAVKALKAKNQTAIAA